MSWEKSGYLILKKALSSDLIRVLARELSIQRDLDALNKKNRVGDAQVKNCYAVYGLAGFEALLDTVVKDIVEKKTKQKVLPSFSYARIYYKGAKLKLHRDRPSCAISVTCCLASNGKSWPIYLQDRQGQIVSVTQQPGDILIYGGSELRHWRENYSGKEQFQAFLHYALKKKSHKAFLYDGRKALGQPHLSTRPK